MQYFAIKTSLKKKEKKKEYGRSYYKNYQNNFLLCTRDQTNKTNDKAWTKIFYSAKEKTKIKTKFV